ncbi:hypothetical protein ACTI_68350 [Actinoplanes sp. OR16]|uniref:helix-turn-helix domain-containing protein n=1 Tax=Actinoplanes sp. OR16 TaxID=946334 RepID=UPI000F709B96|nr:helix-turn-helix transcriptional regulator [Actinoplanes sp. OR16]BBH70150.1 hypothetical protein ACTI_68350 [Actinoplanes sp. OR16]
MDQFDGAAIHTRDDFGAALRFLRRRHAETNNCPPLSLRDIAARTKAGSHNTVSNYLSGRTLPPPETLRRLAVLFGATEDERQALADARSRLSEQRPAKPDAPTPKNRTRSLIALTALLASLATLAVIAFVTDDEPATSAVTAPIPVIVQNKVALGTDGLAEDGTPAYLSARPVPRCARNGCKLAGTEMWSGAAIAVQCQAKGSVMHNYDVAAGAANPHNARSELWYRAAAADGRTGYISEVYLEPRFRGGLGLPQCG